MSLFNKVWNWILELMFPKTCCFCGKISKEELCDDCKNTIIYIKEPRCKKCGKPIRYKEKEYCQDCANRKFYYEQGRSLWIHKEPVSHSIYWFKYHNRRIYSEFYAKELCRIYGSTVKRWGIDLIVPVPLHWKRRLQRGYNQSELIARKVGKMLEIPVETKVVRRVLNTKPQKKLNDKERRRNIKEAFEVTNKGVQNRKILLIDDIYTTGSTINEISRILCEKRQNKVWFLTISIGQDF